MFPRKTSFSGPDRSQISQLRCTFTSHHENVVACSALDRRRARCLRTDTQRTLTINVIGNIESMEHGDRPMKRRLSLGRTANTVLAPLGIRLERAGIQPGPAYRQPYELDSEFVDGLDRETRKVLNLLDYAKSSGSEYSAKAHEAGYHAIDLNGKAFAGQRRPEQRLAGVPIDFTDAIVLDIGCNQGGMLFQISDRIRHGAGIDYDPRMINAANRVRAYKKTGNLDFYVFDLEREDLRLLDSLVAGGRVDVVMLLSVCMWIGNWRQVIAKCSRLADTLLFETNGSREQQDEQLQFLDQTYERTETVRESSPDDTIQQARGLYVCRKPR
jgi:SAM-dependent methyltransferase